ncbi:MAG: sulfur carrier protein ThiS [bacterium]
MQVNINGKPHNFKKELNIQDILKELQIPQEQGIAVALNNTVIAKKELVNTLVKEGDHLEIIHATAGG